MKKKRIKTFVAAGVTLFLVVVAVLVFYDTVFAKKTLVIFFDKLFTILLPIIYGFVMAYLLLPIVNKMDALLHRRLGKNGLKKHSALIRAISIFIAWAFIILIFYILISLILPEVIASITQLVGSVEDYYHQVYDWFTRVLANHSKLENLVLNAFDTFYVDVQNWLKTKVMPQATQFVTMLGTGIWSSLKFLMNLVIGIIVSIYLLYAKESWAAGSRRMVTALFSEEHQMAIFRAVRKVDSIFSGFIRGKLLDSLIIGILCIILCLIIRIPYAALVGVIVGVTNVIPFFGPFLGAIPSALLILLVSPVKCLFFIIMVFALQQFDGYILGPYILGDSTGLSGFWVIAAILVGGGFFGVAGMFFGVPVFACIYALIGHLLRKKLNEKGLSAEISDYGPQPLISEEQSETAEAITK